MEQALGLLISHYANISYSGYITTSDTYEAVAILAVVILLPSPDMFSLF